MKYQKSDSLKITYKGQDHFVLEALEVGRKGRDSSATTVYVLENGKRIVPAHFHHGLARRTGNLFTWLLKAYMPNSLLELELSKPSSFWSKVPKDTAWTGGTYHVPISLKG